MKRTETANRIDNRQDRPSHRATGGIFITLERKGNLPIYLFHKIEKIDRIRKTPLSTKLFILKAFTFEVG